MGAITQFERTLIVERTKAGLVASTDTEQGRGQPHPAQRRSGGGIT
jgi:DNA invertase Pin-like site-specific DNA recombinase